MMSLRQEVRILPLSRYEYFFLTILNDTDFIVYNILLRTEERQLTSPLTAAVPSECLWHHLGAL